ncbi:MAG: NPCBM/NEW2 domain-containing protein [Planctomycetes bacterium]|nr:NPCBM/NEW2 domain-containing protein [Planctomycetota bacterium]
MIRAYAGLKIRVRLALTVVCTSAALVAADDFRVTLLDGSIVEGRLAEVAPRIKLATAAGTIDLGWADILSITPPTAADPAEPPRKYAPWRFTLADGSLFHGSVVGATEDDFIVEFGDRQTCRLSLDALRSIVSTKSVGPARAKIAEIVRDSERKLDYAVIATKERASVLRGAVRRITEQHVIVERGRRIVRIPWPRLAGVFFAASSPRSPSTRVFMTTGEVFAGRVRSGTAEAIMLQSGVFDNLRLPWNRIERIECLSDRLRFLSDLRPQAYEFEPFFEKHWNYAVDKSLSGRPIELGGRAYPRGICMHSQATLTYRIGGQYRQFAFVAGILDEMEDRGNVTMRVLGDGGLLWQRENVRGGAQPEQVVIAVTGVYELTLAVDFGRDLDLSDHACWAFARLIR